MADVSERYRKLSATMTDRVACVQDDRWDAPTPCAGWTVRDLVAHLVDTPAMFFGLVDRPPPTGGPSVAEDPVGAFAHVRDATQAALDDPAVADLDFDGVLGRSTFSEAIGRFICADLVVHGWDLARATGQDDRLDPDEVRRLYEGLLPMDEVMRGPGAFGPKLDPPPGADEQTRLLCFLGRQV